jgi:hypothetical protein
MNDLEQRVLDLQKQVDDLTKKIESFGQKRIAQQDIVPFAIKNRAMGEPNSYIYSGLSANKPTTGVKLTTTGFGCSVWWATDTHVLSLWDGTVWRSVTLS